MNFVVAGAIASPRTRKTAGSEWSFWNSGNYSYWPFEKPRACRDHQDIVRKPT
jgi:hypothetical protein